MEELTGGWRSYTFVFFNKYYYDSQIKDDKMGGIWRTKY
jgi:hypothetical protein